ncbi:hypothetical protein KY289_006251 [Solanum tuberosum]|nr:hypothetical protein KY284_005946 [Solanum tuberosum]KAH0723207.1 hypothetical protein KY289_006251 [Solanum tuberosum]
MMNAGRGAANHAYMDREFRDDFEPIHAGHGMINSGQGSSSSNSSGADNSQMTGHSNPQPNQNTMEYMANTAGATCHMTFKVTNLIEASSKNIDRQVNLPNGQTSSVTQIGDYKLSTGDVLHNVLVDLLNGMVKGIGKENDGLYYLPTHLPREIKSAEHSFLAHTKHSQGLLWHNRLGRPSTKNDLVI